MNIEDNNRLDLLKLYKESLSLLTISKDEFPKIDEDILFPLLHPFLNGEKIYFEMEKKFVSPFCLYDALDEIYYPVFFFNIKKERNMIYKDSTLPYINNAFLSLLKDNSVQLNQNISMNDIPSIYEKIENILVLNKLTNKMKLVPYFHFVDEKVIEYNQNFPFLRNYIFGYKDDVKYDSLFKEIEDTKKEKQLQNDDFGFFSRTNRVFQREDIYHGSSVTINENSVFEGFLIKTITRNCNNNENTLILLDKEDEDDILHILKKYSLLDYTGFVKEMNHQELAKTIFDLKDNTLKVSQPINLFHTKRKTDQFISFRKKREEAFNELFKFRNPSYLNEFHLEHSHVLNMDLSNYTFADQKKDECFFETFNHLSSITSSYIANHIYYGLTSSSEREQYSKLQLILIHLIKYLKEYKEIILSDEDVKKYDLKMDTLNSFSYIFDCAKLLSQYDGFPRKYFKYQEDSSVSITKLKKAFQGFSSTRQLLRTFTTSNLFSYDYIELKDYLNEIEEIKNLVNNYEKQNVFKKWLTKNRLVKKIEIKDKSSFPSVYRVLKGYLLSIDHLNQILPEYKEAFNNNVDTMNGVVQIESNLIYVKKFNEFSKLHPSFQLDHPFIKRTHKDRPFFMKKLKKLEEGQENYLKIIDCLKKYSLYYRDIPLKNLYDISIEDLIKKFSNEQLYSYEEFYDYSSFVKARNQASALLSLMIQRYIRNKWPLVTLQNDFAYSIINKAYENGEKNFEPYNDDYQNIRKEFLNSLKMVRSEKRDEYFEKYTSYVNSLLLKEKTRDVLDSLKDENLGYLDKEKEEEAKQFLSSFHFVNIASTDELYHIPFDLYDHVLILNSHKFSNIHLLSSYRVGKKRIIVSHDGQTDKRTQAYHETVLNRDNMYNKVIRFDDVSKDFLALLNNDCVKHHMELKLDGEKFKFQIKYHDQIYAILPDILINNDIDEESLIELSFYLSRFENITLIVLDTFGYLFKKEDIFSLIDDLSKEKSCS